MLSQWFMQKISTDSSYNQYVYKLARSLEELPMIDAALKCLRFKHKGKILESCYSRFDTCWSVLFCIVTIYLIFRMDLEQFAYFTAYLDTYHISTCVPPFTCRLKHE